MEETISQLQVNMELKGNEDNYFDPCKVDPPYGINQDKFKRV